MVGVLTRLALLTGEHRYRERAEAVIAAFSGELGRNFFPLATLINNAEFALKPVQIVLAGERADPGFAALRRAVYDVSLPNRIVLAVAPDQALPPAHPGFRQRSRRRKRGGLCLRRPGLLAAADRSRRRCATIWPGCGEGAPAALKTAPDLSPARLSIRALRLQRSCSTNPENLANSLAACYARRRRQQAEAEQGRAEQRHRRRFRHCQNSPKPQ